MPQKGIGKSKAGELKSQKKLREKQQQSGQKLALKKLVQEIHLIFWRQWIILKKLLR